VAGARRNPRTPSGPRAGTTADQHWSPRIASRSKPELQRYHTVTCERPGLRPSDEKWRPRGDAPVLRPRQARSRKARLQPGKASERFDGLFLRWAVHRAESSGRSRIPEACVGKAGLARRLPRFLPHPFTDVALRRTRRDHHSGRRRRSSRTRRSVSVSQSPRARENGTVR